jgi:hypothetical protein
VATKENTGEADQVLTIFVVARRGERYRFPTQLESLVEVLRFKVKGFGERVQGKTAIGVAVWEKSKRLPSQADRLFKILNDALGFVPKGQVPRKAVEKGRAFRVPRRDQFQCLSVQKDTLIQVNERCCRLETRT